MPASGIITLTVPAAAGAVNTNTLLVLLAIETTPPEA
jgi:hypothetical protein